MSLDSSVQFHNHYGGARTHTELVVCLDLESSVVDSGILGILRNVVVLQSLIWL